MYHSFPSLLLACVYVCVCFLDRPVSLFRVCGCVRIGVGVSSGSVRFDSNPALCWTTDAYLS